MKRDLKEIKDISYDWSVKEINISGLMIKCKKLSFLHYIFIYRTDVPEAREAGY